MVVTYSSCLALLYFSDDAKRLDRRDIERDPRRSSLYDGLLANIPVWGCSELSTALPYIWRVPADARVIVDGRVEVLEGGNPLEPYGSGELVVRAVEHLVKPAEHRRHHHLRSL